MRNAFPLILVLLFSSGCSVAMALNGKPQPNFEAFEVGSKRQMVELQLGTPVSSEPLEGGRHRDAYQFEMGNSPNGHRALWNLYMDFATFGIWEIPGTVIEGVMGEEELTYIVYDQNDRVVSIEGYTPPKPSPALQEAIAAQKGLSRHPIEQTEKSSQESSSEAQE
ncbi:hypothetical protein [Candidatus Nitronereus thalassa]|uniref:Lipoprotein n=1 Tax=Candidatus Nitronereus thalassa TaxID=3020898 RepID=A0ABU3K814_9BACT|nr:hypothetical protein [Candidatus Nitronereus thalassa]MDT7042584.1 hypothetical protein [Candidatus Nitronereus thalassa]